MTENERQKGKLACVLAWLWAHQNSPVSFKKALIVVLIIAAAGFFVGRLHPESDYADLQGTANELRADFRQLAQDREEDEIELRRLRLQARLDEQTIAQLQTHSRNLTKENLQQLEKEIFYRKLGARTKEKLNIYALDETPDFRPGVRRFSAALITPPRRKFVGGYYFEVVTETNGVLNEELIRVPKEGTVPLSVNIYADIEETVELSDDLEVNKLRLVVVDKDGNQAAEAILQAEQGSQLDAESPVGQEKNSDG